MTKAIRYSKVGGPEVMQYVDVDVGAPGPGEARVKNHAIGLNFIDIYYRTGLYPQPMPAGLGMEGAGTIEALGPGETDLMVGDRVAYACQPPGAYAEQRLMPTAGLVKLPDTISFEAGAAMMLQGLTVQYLFRRTFRLEGAETILFHAAAGGVGLIACQWAKALGVTMIGTVGSEEKAKIAKAHGCTHTINYKKESLVDRVKELTNGAGVPVVYDSIGADTFTRSLDCLSPLGMMVSFGSASGPVPPVAINELSVRGSLFLTRPVLFHYTAKPEALRAMAAELFEMVSSGKVKIDAGQKYPLREAAHAHRDLEGRMTTGSTILLP